MNKLQNFGGFTYILSIFSIIDELLTHLQIRLEITKKNQGNRSGALKFIELSSKFQKFDKSRLKLKMTSEVKGQSLL